MEIHCAWTSPTQLAEGLLYLVGVSILADLEVGVVVALRVCLDHDGRDGVGGVSGSVRVCSWGRRVGERGRGLHRRRCSN
jgi:hypothetical protein